METRPPVNRELAIRGIQAQDWGPFWVNRKANPNAQRPTFLGQSGKRAHRDQLHNGPWNLSRKRLAASFFQVGQLRNSGKRASWSSELSFAKLVRSLKSEELGFGNGFWRNEWEKSQRLSLEKHLMERCWFQLGEFETKRVIMYWRSMRKRGGDLKYSDSFGVAVGDLGMMISWEKNRRGVITCFRV